MEKEPKQTVRHKTNRVLRAMFLLVGMCCFFAGSVQGQQPPQYTQYMFNQFGLNPAVAGSFDCIDLKAGYRNQWVGFEGAPKSWYLSAHGPLRLGTRDRKHGVGAYLVQDKVGPVTDLYVHLAYAFHVKVKERMYMSMGFFLGFQNYRFDSGQLTVPDPTDQAIAGSSTSFIIPDIMPGIWWYTRKSYMGLSMKHMMANNIKAHGPNSNLENHFYFMAGHKLASKKGIVYTPSVMVKKVGAAPIGIDASVLADFNEAIGLGASYRIQDAVAAIIRVRVSYSLGFAYSYDITTSKIRHDSSNSHEITLSWNPCGKSSRGVGAGGGGTGQCPAYH